MTGLAERAQIAPRQPQLWMRPHCLNVVDLIGNSAALTHRMGFEKPSAAFSPRGIVATLLC